MRAIRTLSLSHFRSHRTWSIETDGRPIALFGPNGAGKTNILEAISMLSPGRGLRRAQAEELIRRPEAIGWKVSAVIDGAERHEVATAVEAPGQRRGVWIDGKVASQAALGALASMIWLTPAMDRLWAEGAAERRRFLDRAVLSFEPGHGDRVIAYEKAMRERNRLLKDGVGDAAWLSALEAQMAKAGAAMARARAETVARLMTAQEDAETAFPRAEISIEGDAAMRFAAVLTGGGDPSDEEGAAEAALAASFASGRRADGQAGRTLSGPHRSDLATVFAPKGVAARLCSTGEQKALLISLVLANARALAAEAGAPPIILLDEVAAHLDEDRRAALYDEICALGAQAWMTGTGPELFTALGDRGVHIAV
ncbi:MAG: DNA replication/repair protein RecF [Pseudomonadota bacterium]